VVVEGYMDVVSLAQFGINNAVASLGTALTEKQVDRLFQQASNLYFCFDGDKAGRQAAWKALQLILPQMKAGRRAHFILLPQGEDPDSFVHTHGKAAFVEKMERAATLSDFLFEQLSANLDLQHLDARAQLVTLAKPLIQKIPTGVLQEMFYNRLAEIAKIDSGFIQGKKNNAVRNVSRLRNRRTLPPTAANRILALLLRDRSLIQLLNGIELEGEDTKLLCAIIEVLRVEAKSSIELIQGCLPSELASQFSYEDLKAIADPIPEQGAEEEFLGALQTFRNRKQDAEVEKLLEIAKTRGLSLEEKSQLKLLLNKKHESSVD
jgi:DNA primase